MRADNFEDALDRMMQAYEKFSAHLINVEQHFDHNQYPIQRFGRARNPPRNELDPKDRQHMDQNQNQHQDNQQPRRDHPGGVYNPNHPNEMVCFRCRQPGHFKDQCHEQPLPYNARRDRVNTIHTTAYESDYEEFDTDFETWDKEPSDRKVSFDPPR